jgi:hypothetical protein
LGENAAMPSGRAVPLDRRLRDRGPAIAASRFAVERGRRCPRRSGPRKALGGGFAARLARFAPLLDLADLMRRPDLVSGAIGRR